MESGVPEHALLTVALRSVPSGPDLRVDPGVLRRKPSRPLGLASKLATADAVVITSCR